MVVVCVVVVIIVLSTHTHTYLYTYIYLTLSTFLPDSNVFFFVMGFRIKSILGGQASMKKSVDVDKQLTQMFAWTFFQHLNRFFGAGNRGLVSPPV